MKWFYNILLFFIGGFIFLGASGVIVHEHYCKKDGLSVSFYLPVYHDCHDDVIKSPKGCEQNACCAQKTSSNDFRQITQEPCCQESVNYLHFDQDWNGENSGELYTPLLCAYNDKILMELCLKNQSICNDFTRPPPPISLKVRLALLQTYVI